MQYVAKMKVTEQIIVGRKSGWLTLKCSKGCCLDFSSTTLFLELFVCSWLCVLPVLWCSLALWGAVSWQGFIIKSLMYLMIAVSKLNFWSVFSYLSPTWEMLFNLLFLWMIILINPLDILILLWYCSQLSKCYFNLSSAVYSSSSVVCSGLPILLKFHHHLDTLHQAEYYPCECCRMLKNFGGGNSLSNHRLYDRLLTCCSSTHSYAFLSNRENKFVLLPLDARNTEYINISIFLFQAKQHRII